MVILVFYVYILYNIIIYLLRQLYTKQHDLIYDIITLINIQPHILLTFRPALCLKIGKSFIYYSYFGFIVNGKVCAQIHLGFK